MFPRAAAIFLSVLLTASGVASADTGVVPATMADQLAPVAATDRVFVEDLEHRSFVYFWEQADRGTGLVLDRARVDGGRAKGPSRDIASAAATGFGLTATCIGVE